MNFSAWMRRLLVGVGRDVEQVLLAGRRLHQEQVAEVGQGLGGDVAQVLTVLHQPADDLEDAPGVAHRDRIGQLVLDLAARRTQQRVAPRRRRSCRRPARWPGRAARARRARSPRPAGRSTWAADSVSVAPSAAAIDTQLGGERLEREPTEVEPLAAAHDRGRHLVRLGGGQHEPHARRRLLEDLQQGVERLAGQPLRLVDDVDLLAALHGRGGRLLAQLARILDATVAGGVDLDHVQVRALTDRDALGAHAARLGRGALLAVDHLGEDASGGGLARAPGPAEQERVVQAAFADRAGERADTWSWPRTSCGVCGRYRRYRAWCCISSATHASMHAYRPRAPGHPG